MSRWISRASASMDLDAYTEEREIALPLRSCGHLWVRGQAVCEGCPEAVPVAIDDEPATAPVEYCLDCGRPLDDDGCPARCADNVCPSGARAE